MPIESLDGCLCRGFGVYRKSASWIELIVLGDGDGTKSVIAIDSLNDDPTADISRKSRKLSALKLKVDIPKAEMAMISYGVGDCSALARPLLTDMREPN